MFGVLLTATRGLATGHEFFAGYLVEQTLSIDNLFAFIMLFDYFHVPMELQSRVLSWGVAGAAVLRGLMIAVGVRAIQQFQAVILVFASILLASSFKLLTETEKGKEDNLGDNVVMKFTRALLPNTSADFHGERFFVTNEMGKRIATPLFLCLVCVELSDFVFAVDSIPAVLGVSKDPLVVFASNIFAMLTMRSLYTLVAKAVTELRYLKPAVATVLAFVATKMIGEYFHVVIGTGASLGVICSVLGAGIIASIWENKQKRLRLPSVRFPSWAKMTLAR
jgi:TerC family integral membrane protein